jgi:LPXTG-motif cell wall-anchored protein
MKMNRLKQLLSLGILCLLFLIAPPITEAAEQINVPDGFLIGDDQGITVTKTGGYFFNLEGLLPGDRITRNLIIQNTKKEDYTLKMLIEPVSTVGPINLLEKMTMEFNIGDRKIYDGNLVNEDQRKTDQGTEIDFGTIAAGSKQTMSIVLKMKTDVPWEKFKAGESKAKVRWTFVADSKKTTPSTSDSTTFSDRPTKPIGKYPNTGETPSKILFTLGGLMLIITVIIYFSYYRREVNNDKHTHNN